MSFFAFLAWPHPCAYAVAPQADRAVIRVRFERLSPLAQVAEAQKDILLQMLRDVSSPSAVFIEGGDDEGASPAALDTPGRRLTIRCDTCLSPRTGEALLARSVEVQKNAASKNRMQVRFSVGAAPGEDAGPSSPASTPHTPNTPMTPSTAGTWAVDIEEIKARFVVRLGADVHAGQTVALSMAAVQACYDAKACGPLGAAFASEADAFAFHEGLQGKEATRGMPAGSILGPRDVRTAIVVRMGDTVRIRVLTSGQGLAIRTRGRALQAGAQGDTVGVELSSFSGVGGAGATAGNGTRRTLQTTVKGKGEVDYVLE